MSTSLFEQNGIHALPRPELVTEVIFEGQLPIEEMHQLQEQFKDHPVKHCGWLREKNWKASRYEGVPNMQEGVK